jgi:hypothetical protein
MLSPFTQTIPLPIPSIPIATGPFPSGVSKFVCKMNSKVFDYLATNINKR